jgi:hypothetical protein
MDEGEWHFISFMVQNASSVTIQVHIGEDTNCCREHASAHRRLQLESDPPFQVITKTVTGEKGKAAITETKVAETSFLQSP